MTIEELKSLMREHRSEENRFYMEKYMRNQFPFLGIKTPERREILKGFLKTYDTFHLRDVLSLYEEEEREFRYTALSLLERYVEKLRYEDLEELLVLALTDPWWDTIDSFSPSIFGPMALKDQRVKEKMRDLIYEENIWLKRISILFQLKYKDKMDEALLTEAIINNAHTKEFFVDKAIGWVLREYSKTKPQFVRRFLTEHELSSLSVRECSKYI